MKALLKYILLTGFVFFLSVTAEAERRPRFEYGLNFDFRFDNREYDASESFSPSMTVLGAHLSPVVGLSYNPGKWHHEIMAGADVFKDFGTEASAVRAEMLLYYRAQARFAKTKMSLTAGIFPRSMASGDYSTAFLSDSLRFYDHNLEGLLLTFTRSRSYYEVGCDWMGKFGPSSRERFEIFAAGHSWVLPFMKLGYAASMYHFAGSEQVRGVVDHILVNPWLTFEAGPYIGIQSLAMTMGWLQSMQNDRKNVGSYVFPGGGEVVLKAANWNVGVENRLYYGSNLMPYYNSTDLVGNKYGTDLYRGDSFYRVSADGKGLYDRLEVYYAPKIADFVKLKVAVVCHFHNGFSGWQQIVGINVDLNRHMFERKSGR